MEMHLVHALFRKKRIKTSKGHVLGGYLNALLILMNLIIYVSLFIVSIFPTESLSSESLSHTHRSSNCYI